MVTQAHPITPAYAMPEARPTAKYSATYIVVAPDELTLPQIKASALSIVADAGLPIMPVSVQQDLGRDDKLMWQLYAYETGFNTIAVYAYAGTSEEALAEFSKKLGAWARRTGLLPAMQTMEGSPARA